MVDDRERSRGGLCSGSTEFVNGSSDKVREASGHQLDQMHSREMYESAL